MIDELVSRVFATRNALHLKHWATTSYAAHMALGDLYEQIISTVDDVVEMYMGATGKIISDAKPRKVGDDIIEHLRDEAEWIEEHIDEISAGVLSVENALQDLSGAYFKAIYKLTRFK